MINFAMAQSILQYGITPWGGLGLELGNNILRIH